MDRDTATAKANYCGPQTNKVNLSLDFYFVNFFFFLSSGTDFKMPNFIFLKLHDICFFFFFFTKTLRLKVVSVFFFPNRIF